MSKFNIKNRRYLGSKAKLLSFITEVVIASKKIKIKSEKEEAFNIQSVKE